MLPRSHRYEARYREAWLEEGAGEVSAIYPPANLILESNQLRELRESTGLFMAGGNTSLYQKIYGRKSVSRLIKELHDAGVPYGGVSAGAMMACSRVVAEGTTIRTRANEIQLVADSSLASSDPGRPGVVVGKGLGLVQNCILEPHFAEWGRFPRLVEVMDLTGSRFGVGVDASICLEIRDGRRASVRGRGMLYLFRRETNGARGRSFHVRLYEPGARFEFPAR